MTLIQIFCIEFPFSQTPRRFFRPEHAKRIKYKIVIPRRRRFLFFRRPNMVCVTASCTVSSMMIVVVWSSAVGRLSASPGIDSLNALDCNQKPYTFQVSNTDVNGRTCSGRIKVMSCWGRCDSNEVLAGRRHTASAIEYPTRSDNSDFRQTNGQRKRHKINWLITNSKFRYASGVTEKYDRRGVRATLSVNTCPPKHVNDQCTV